MKKILQIGVFLSLACPLWGQNALRIEGGHLRVGNSTYLVLQNTQWVNNGAFSAGSGTVSLTGDSPDSESTLGGSSATAFHNLQINKSANGVQLGRDVQVDNELQMTAGNLDLNGFDLTLGEANGAIIGESAGSYIHGAAGGEVVKTTTLSAPAAVNPGNIGATITSGQDLGSTTIRRGHPPHTIYGAEGIRRYYDISPANNTGLAATLRLAYLDHELNGIEEAELEAVKKVDPSWHYYTTNTYDLAANYVETDGIDAFNTWTLAPAPIKLMPRAFLQGPYAAGQMNDGLRSGSLIPSTEPYTGLGYAHTGYGGNEAMEPALLNNTGNDAIVDWMIVELRNATDNTQVLHSRASLIQRDGDITGLNGKDPVAFPGAAEGDYYVVLRHRNHLGVMSAGSVSLSSGLANAYDFTSSSAMATGVNPMAEVSAGVWALWGGNANGDGAVRASGPSFINDYSRLLSYLGGATNLVFGAYTREDLNMDGNVRASGPSLINDYSKLLNVLGTSTTIITQGF